MTNPSHGNPLLFPGDPMMLWVELGRPFRSKPPFAFSQISPATQSKQLPSSTSLSAPCMTKPLQ